MATSTGKQEQRANIKFCFLLGKTAAETLTMLQAAYKEDALGKTQVYEWFGRFKKGQMSSQWKHRGSPRPKKARQVRSVIKTMLICFFDVQGIVHSEFVPPGQTVNQDYYIEVLRRLREAVRRRGGSGGRVAEWRQRACAQGSARKAVPDLKGDDPAASSAVFAGFSVVRLLLVPQIEEGAELTEIC